MIIVFDTNVLYAAFMSPSGACAQLLEEHLGGPHTIVVSQFILDELRRHLTKRLSQRSVDSAIVTLLAACRLVVPDIVPPNACRDPDDLPVLGTAAAGQADVLITGDKDLLVLVTHGHMQIVSPRGFLEQWSGMTPP